MPAIAMNADAENEEAETEGTMSETVTLEAIGWKRRSGFAKYSDTVGVGSSWERRRFTLTAGQLKYYNAPAATAASSSSSGAGVSLIKSCSGSTTLEDEHTPRGTFDLAPERTTIILTYPADPSQPTPYALSVNLDGGADKWKLCFDDRETQLIWLVALTDVVAGAGAWEPLRGTREGGNGAAQNRLYDGDGGRLLDRVQSALSEAGAGNTTRNEAQEEEAGTEAIEVVKRSLQRSLSRSIGVSIRMNPASEAAAPPEKSRKVAAESESKEASLEEDLRKDNELPDVKLFQSLAVVVISLVFEKLGCLSSSLLWKLVSAIVLCICFRPEVQSDGKKREGTDEDPSINKEEAPGGAIERNATEAAELMRAEGVPLCPAMPSVTESPGTDGDNGGGETTPTHRREPLTEDEMKSNSHQRWAMSAPTVDLSGQWTLIVDPAFKTEYAAYLKQLGFNGVTRKVACSVIARTSEITAQSDNGRELYLKGTNPKGAWERTLTASGFPDFETLPERKEGEDYSHTRTSIKTADSEDVLAEAWWEEGGTKHRSWLRGGKKYGGGDFESLRYLEESSEGDVLVCESCFWPKDASKEKAVVNWRFKRDDVADPI